MPVLILVLSGAISLSLIDSFLARRQVEGLVSQRAAAVVAGVAQRLEERQRAQALLAQVLAAQPDLAGAVERGDVPALTRELAPLQAGMEAGSTAVIGTDGRPLVQFGAPGGLDAAPALAATALAGAPRSLVRVEASGLSVLAAAPIRSAREVVGALVLSTPVDTVTLRQAVAGDDVELALFRDGRLVSTTAGGPALVALLRDLPLTPDQLGQLNSLLARVDYWAAARPLGDDGLLLTLVSLHNLMETSRERTLIVLLGSLELVIALIAVGLLLVRDIAGPVEAMVAAARTMARGQYLQEVPASPIRELNDLGGAINFLAQQVQRHIAQLTHQAFYDSLSELPNRALFMDRLERALARADRRERAVAVLFLDLDNFKVVNDSLGHHAGDRLLVAAAKRLSMCLRRNDTLARFGGDEFTILLEDVRDIHEVTLVAKRIQGALRTPFVVNERTVFTTASIGIALSSPEHHTPDVLLRDADLALYRAKTHGKARYEVFDPAMNADAMHRLELETDLRNAIQNGELLAYYQPLIELASGRLCGASTRTRSP
jgi:diguanylate cyclase (GGDEF)-like protein